MIRLTDSPTENHRKLNRNTPKASYISMTKRAGIRLPGSRVGGVERDRDALARPCEPFHAMLQPRREKEQATGGRRERNSQTRTRSEERRVGKECSSRWQEED